MKSTSSFSISCLKPIESIHGLSFIPTHGSKSRGSTLTKIRPTNNLTAITQADVLLIAVKPQDAGRLLDEFGSSVPPDKLVVSLCAGLPTSFFAQRLPDDIPVVRVMTNTPALVDQAMTVISAGPHATDDHLALTEEIFQPLGKTMRVPEAQQDAVTALSGSGPADIFYFIEAMQAVASELGFDEAQARALTLNTFAGAAQLAMDSSESAAALREKVTSKGGTTAAALASFEHDKVDEAIARAIRAAAARARELGS